MTKEASSHGSSAIRHSAFRPLRSICDDQRSPLQIEMPETTAPPKPKAHTSPYTRANPFPGKLVVNRRLSGPESQKETRHFEIDLTGWGLSFEVGDSVAIYPTNDPDLVEEIIRALGAKGDEPVPVVKSQKAL